ncbi:MAG: hypothetical protein CO090_05550 [Acidobacteria bacterium CG_4_9_14_3_um_filter_49_7]|nr:MAG: hypothetical protein CO090_05550 [Acidobacteria bacterium CG_4_9_14_3_um_filter_49_7]
MTDALLNTGRLSPEQNGFDLKGMTPEQRKVLYYNIMFPGMGFVYAGDLLRSLVFGGGALGFLLLGFGLIWKSAMAGEIQFGSLFGALAVPGICFVLMLVFHLLSILKSLSAKVSTPSSLRAVLYTTLSMILAISGIIIVLAAVWQSVPWQ